MGINEDDSNHAATSACTKCTELLVRRSKFLSGNIDNSCKCEIVYYHPVEIVRSKLSTLNKVCVQWPAPIPSAEEDEYSLT